jgi:hypothetical protein
MDSFLMAVCKSDNLRASAQNSITTEYFSITLPTGENMAIEDNMCTIVPYFTVPEGKLLEFKALAEQMVETTRSESACLFYGFCFNGQRAFCREGYVGGEGVLAHLENIDSLLQQALAIASLDTLEVHGPADELAKLQEPLSALSPAYFTLECGFRR